MQTMGHAMNGNRIKARIGGDHLFFAGCCRVKIERCLHIIQQNIVDLRQAVKKVIGDRLWNGEALDEETNGRVLGLYRLTFADPTVVAEEVRNEPVYLIMAMSAQKLVRLKPQNLLTGLPIRHLEAVT